ncbi:MAG TPA: dihydroxyacetone kinase subunit DhaL, partial [Kribbella sp.]|nr:dihydroxyacetone kinase subunit DhaL [Kribbella sp.]
MTDLVKAASAAAWVRAFARLVAEHEDELTRLDAAIGDADHGANMRRGLTAAVDALDRGERWASPGPLLASTGTTLISAIGGAAGPLFGTFFLRMGDALHDPADVGSLAVALRAGLDGVVERGKAEPKDKTMYDALRPAVDAVQKC